MFEFYEIKSIESLYVSRGLRKRYFAAEGNGNFYFFMWVDKGEALRHIQFVFEENIIEWNAASGILAGCTNRKEERAQLLQRGARTIKIAAPGDQEGKAGGILQQSFEILEQSVYPAGIKELILSALKRDASKFAKETAEIGDKTKKLHPLILSLPAHVLKILRDARIPIFGSAVPAFKAQRLSPLGKLLEEEFDGKVTNSKNSLAKIAEGLTFVDKNVNMRISRQFRKDLLEWVKESLGRKADKSNEPYSELIDLLTG